MSDRPRSWDEVVNAAIALRESRDDKSWEFGELLAWACPVEDKESNLSSLAAALQMQRAQLSELRGAFLFWKDHRHHLPAEVSWTQANWARKQVGWSPGKDVQPDHVRAALIHLENDLDGGRKAPPKSWNRYVKECTWRLAKAIKVAPPDAVGVLTDVLEALDALEQ